MSRKRLIPVKDIDTLKKLTSRRHRKFEVLFGGMVRMTSTIEFDSESGRFHVFVDDDGTDCENDERELMRGNIGKAMKDGTLFIAK